MTMIDIHFVSTAQQIRRGLKQPRKQKHQSFFSVSRMKQHRKRMMAGVDFNVLRNEITMQDVLDQLRFRPTTRSGDQLHGALPGAWFEVTRQPNVFSELGESEILLPQMSQPRKPT